MSEFQKVAVSRVNEEARLKGFPNEKTTGRLFGTKKLAVVKR